MKISEKKHITKDGMLKKNPVKGWKKYTAEQYEKLGHHSVEGQIVEFDPPLYVYGYKKPDKEGGISIMPSVHTTEPVGRFMLVEGGFGASFNSMGRMLIGKYFESLEDVEKNHPIGWDQDEYDFSGNTKESYKFIWVRK